jgi:nitrate reductase beta subunit
MYHLVVNDRMRSFSYCVEGCEREKIYHFQAMILAPPKKKTVYIHDSG